MQNVEHGELREKIVIFGKTFLTIFNIIAAIASIIGLIYTMIEGFSIRVILFAMGIIICMGAIASIIGVHLSTKNDRVSLGKIYSKCFHELMHNIRNMLEDDDLIQLRAPYNSSATYRDHVTEQSIKLMNELSSHLTEAFHIDVRACIKLFDFISPNAVKPYDVNCPITQDFNVLTFARSNMELNEMKREQHRKIPVKHNTDFEYIFYHKGIGTKENPAFFFKQNLIKFAKEEAKQGRKYKNSTLDWKKKYRTTIVMPIRYLKDPDDDNPPRYDLLGYLCVDSMNTKAFSSGYTTFILELLKGLADILYHYYDGCTSYYKILSAQNKVIKSLEE